jgi:PAS domain S-box-containing protein
MSRNIFNRENKFEQLNKALKDAQKEYEQLKNKYEKAISEYTSTINQLTESDKRNRNLFYNAPINYLSLDQNLQITDANSTLLNSMGFKTEEIVGFSFTDFMTDASAALFSSLYPEFEKAGQIHNVELELIRNNGMHLFVSLDGKITVNKDGNFEQIHIIWTDITRHKEVELLQHENEISYRELFNNVADAIYIQDEKGIFLDVNDGAVKMYGHPREVLIGKDPSFVSAPGKNDMLAVQAMVDRAFAGEPQQFEFWGLRSNGEIFPKEVRIVNGTYFGKKVNIAMAQDITDRKKTETALQESERRYRELIELAVDGILIGSNDGIIIGANTYMQHLTGRSLDHLTGIHINELFSPASVNDKPLRFDLLQNGETVFSERDILRADGSIVPIEMHTKMMPDGTYQSIYRDVTERKKAEETLRQSESKFKSLVESTSDMIWETNIDGVYTYVSPQFESLLGYTTKEAIGKSPFYFIADEHISTIKANSDSIVRKETPFVGLVNKYKHHNGNILYFETNGVPVYNNSGKLTGYRGISRNITERYNAEKELHKLSLVVQQSPNTIIITDLTGKIEYINPAGCELSGYSFEELKGKNPSIFSAGETTAETYKTLWKTITAGQEWRGVFHNKKKNGDYYWESVFIVPLRDTEGNIKHYLGVKDDISPRVQAENALLESEIRYRELFESSPDAIILAEIESGMLVDANTSACNLLGRTLEEIRQMHHTMLHPPHNKAVVVDLFDTHVNASKSRNNFLPLETSIIRSDGAEIPVEVLASSISLGGKQILQGVFRNITERKLAEKELLKAKEKAEASDKLKSAFLNNISHELRTPLNGIIGFSEMLAQPDSTDEDRLEFTKMIKKSSNRLINTITSYMDISMIVSGITEIRKRRLNLSQFLNKIADQANEVCNSRDLELKIIRDNYTPDNVIVTDEILLTKIFTHLIDNAVKFTKEGSITIGYEHKPGFHQFFVKDTGSGIPKESVSVIFEVFMQADLSTSRGYEGSGVGLSIARGFVNLLGGEIWVESNNNEGSSFFFTIPENEDLADIHLKKETNQKMLQPVILVAEDEDSNYKYLEIVLKKASFVVYRSINGFETVEMCRSHPEINMLLMDLKMPGMDGFEATRQIRKISPKIPVIALSAFISEEDQRAAIEAGCNEFLLKPVNKVKLLETIEKLL